MPSVIVSVVETSCPRAQTFCRSRVPELDRWLQVLLLKPQTRTHLLLFQFLGLVEGWDGAELETFLQFLGGRTANSSNAELLSPSPSVQTTSDSEMTWPI